MLDPLDERPISAVLVVWGGSFAHPGRHSPQFPLISPTFTKGLLKGAALAVAGAAALGAGSAFALPSCVGASLGSLTACTLGNFDFTPTSQNITGTGVPQNYFISFALTGNKFKIFSTGSEGALNGSLGFNLTLTNSAFLTGVSLESGGFPGASTTLTGNPAASLSLTPSLLLSDSATITGSPVSGSYSYNFTGRVNSTASFTSDVPVPLPIVGAGLALGFTRNLRKRAKSLA